MADDSEDENLWKPPANLTADQLVDWRQAHQYAENARAVRHLGRRTEALEKLVESIVKPVVEESNAWTATKRQISETLWHSGVGPIKTGPTVVGLTVIVGLAVLAQQCGVDPIDLSQELRSWKNGECVESVESLPVDGTTEAP